MYILNSYSVTMMINDNKTIYEQSYVNDIDNTNKAIKWAIEILSAMKEDKYVGILVLRLPVRFYDDGKSECDYHVFDTYDHISNDKSNWVTVKEAKQALMSIKA